MALVSRSPSAAEFRDKRYSGQALLIDLHDAECEALSWTPGSFAVTAGPRAILETFGGDRVVTAVFTFDGEPDHGLFEARVEQLDAARGMLSAHFMWVNDAGQKLLKTMANRHPEQPMRIAFTRVTHNWSFSGFLVGDYRGALKDGERVRGMIWSDDPKDPGLFAGHAVRVNREKHTFSVEFDDLPSESFTLLESAIRKRDAHFSGKGEA